MKNCRSRSIQIKRTFLYLSVALLTCSAGLAAARLVDRRPQRALAIIRLFVPGMSGLSSRFTPIGRACGLGSAVIYKLPDGRIMREGAACQKSEQMAQREWQKLLSRATTIVERVPDTNNRFGRRGERLVAWFPADQSGAPSAKVMWYGGGECYLYIDAPSLDLALEFERANAYAY